MIPLAVGIKLFKAHWGKVLAGVFVAAWIWITLGLYGETQDLTMALGVANSAVDVCIADRANMDNELLLLKADIAMIQAYNAQYKASLKQAENSIEALEGAIEESIDAIDQEVIPESCEGSMDWMLERALKP